MDNIVSTKINRLNCTYTACYCEENIWKLCERIKEIDVKLLANCFVVFVSNDIKKVPIWFQKSGLKQSDFLCVWDYHVFLIQINTTNNVLVYDFDTVLEFPVSFENYTSQALKPEFNLQYERLFRVVSSEMYLSTFASDRSHMKQADGSYSSVPPLYAPIATKDCTNNLSEFISMEVGIGPGEVMNMNMFIRYFMPSI